MIGILLALAVSTVMDSHELISNSSDGVTVRISREGVVSNDETIGGVVLIVEAADARAAADHGYTSLTSVVDIDCAGERDRVRRAIAYNRPHMMGPAQPWPTPGTWVRPTPQSYMTQVIERVCGRNHLRVGVRQNGPRVIPRSARASGASPPIVSPLVANQPSPVPTGQIATTAQPGAAVDIGTRVQIASSKTREEAQTLLTSFKERILPPHRGRVETASVHGRTVYRSVIEPFGSITEAQTFCSRWKQDGGNCIVWQSRGRMTTSYQRNFRPQRSPPMGRLIRTHHLGRLTD